MDLQKGGLMRCRGHTAWPVGLSKWSSRRNGKRLMVWWFQQDSLKKIISGDEN